MDTFKNLFGVDKAQIKPVCVLLPFLRREILEMLGVKKIFRGRLYGVGQSGYFTVIHTGMGATFLGDAVLHLEETACREVILFGACGLVDEKKGLKIGSLVSPFKCYSFESFSRMLLSRDQERDLFYPDRKFHQKLLRSGKSAGIKAVVALSVGSLKLQAERLDSLRRGGVEVVDLECAALFAASHAIGRSSLALLFVTDIVGEKPYYRSLSGGEKLALLNTIRTGGRFLCGFIKEKRKG